MFSHKRWYILGTDKLYCGIVYGKTRGGIQLAEGNRVRSNVFID